MHYGKILLVKAKDREGAVSGAKDFLEGYEGDVWDWYTIGGRWSGEFTTHMLGKKYPKAMEKFNKEFEKQKLGWVSSENSTEKQHQRSDELFKKCFPEFDGLIPVYRDQYQQGGFPDDIQPLADVLDCVRTWNGIFIDKKEDTKKAVKVAIDKNDFDSYDIKRLADMQRDWQFTSEVSVYDCEESSQKIPADVTGYYAVMVDLHN